MFVRTSLLSNSSIWKCCPEYGYVWLQLKGIIHSHTSLYICCCYLPPHDSMYFAHSGVSPSQVLDAIQFDVATLQAAGHSLLIAGDLNARTGQHQDCVVDVLPDVSCMLDVPVTVPTRVNTDVITSPQGKLLLDFCLGSGLVIFNGRCPGDLHGSFTLHSHNGGFSCVDYFLGSPELLSNVHRLRVCPKLPESDHCPLALSLTIEPPSLPHTTRPTLLQYRKNADLIPAYVANLHRCFDGVSLVDTTVDSLADLITAHIQAAAMRTYGQQGDVVPFPLTVGLMMIVRQPRRS